MKWFHGAAWTVSIVLLIVSVFLIIIGLFFVDDSIQGILTGIATNLFSITVTVTFVQHLFDRQQSKQDKNEERNKILRYNRIMEQLIREYICYHNVVLSPLEGRNEINSTSFKENVHFSDLKDLYYTSNVIKDGFYESAIEAYYKAEKQLIDFCYSCVCNIEYKYYSELGEVVLELIIQSNKNDCKDSIIKNKNMLINGQDSCMYYRDLISNESQNWVEEFDSGKLSGSLLIPYIILFKYLNATRELISEYMELMDLINKECESTFDIKKE